MVKIIKKYLPITLVLLAAAFLRFYRLKDFFQYTIDEEYLSQLAWTIVHDFHVIWIGVSAGSTNFYLGPGYIYVTAFLLWVGKGNSLALAYWVSFIGVATVFSIWWIVKKTVTPKAALIASSSYGFSYFIALYDRHFWPPVVSFTLLWMVYFLWEARKDTRWLIPFFFVLGVSLHLHLSLFVCAPIALWAVIRSRKQLRLSTILLSVISYLLAVSPLIVYDFVHNFDNLRAPFLMLSHSSGGSLSLIPRLSTMLIVVSKIVDPATSTIFLGAILVLFCALGVFALRKKIPTFVALSLATFGLLTILFFIYPGRAEEYYLIGTFPFIAVLFSYVLQSYVPQKPLIFLLSIFLISSIFMLATAKPLYNAYSQKEKVIEAIKKVTKNEPMLLITKSPYVFDGGWHFLFTQAGIPVTQGSSSEMYNWIYTQYYTPPTKAKYTVVLENGDKGVRYKIKKNIE